MPDESGRTPLHGSETLSRAAGSAVPHPDEDDERRLVLSELVSRVLDKGVLLHGSVTIAVADIDLIVLELDVLLYAAESAVRRASAGLPRDADLPVPPPSHRE